MGLGKAVRSWFQVKGRSAEHISFGLRRLAGIVLALYLVIHMVDISTLLLGREYYQALLNLFSSPVGLVFDIILWILLVAHGSLGLYSAIVEAGFLVDRRKELLVAAWAVVALFSLVGAVVIIHVMG